MKDKIREWVDLASIDLAAAEKLLDDENLTTIVSFHAHQCIEKIFKAVIELHEGNVPKVHDLTRLFGEISDFIDMKIDIDMLDELSRLYIDSRYPALTGLMPYGRPSFADAKRYVEFSSELYNTIRILVDKE